MRAYPESSRWLSLALLACAGATAADERIEELVVVGPTQEASLPGSGYRVDAATLERFDFVDLHQALSFVPGVYLREEDGFGLRPNIGIRGAAAERSQKVTIMEDGVLIAPAPYSAPAAYYTPNVSRLSAIEVLKGPSAIHHGPHTVGGAVNFITGAVPVRARTELDASLGNHGFHKLRGVKGGASAQVDYLVDALRYGSSGFKDIDGGGDTGFLRHGIDAKLRWRPGRTGRRLTLKLGYSDEDADETYLGLTDYDFSRTPYRRYPASKLARFQSSHYLVHVGYRAPIERGGIDAKLYWNRFERGWNKVDGFVDGPALPAVFARPAQFARHYRLLTGDVDSSDAEGDLVDITNNDRGFASYGAQANVKRTFAGGGLTHTVTAGLRLHHDEVRRDHRPRAYRMIAGDPVWDGVPLTAKVRNRADADAVAAFVSDEMVRDRWRLTLGVRFEQIAGEFEDRKTLARRTSDQSVFSPGAGVFWQATERFGLLAGVYRGFSPAGPGAADVDPERSLNFEYGLRYATENARFEVVGFFSDYENLLGRCRVSDSGCEPGDEFNGGRVEVAGLELTAAKSFSPLPEVGVDLRFNYTYTESAFQNSLFSQFPQWGLVRRGDELPYLPTHVGRVGLGVIKHPWEFSASVRGQSQVREEPGFHAIDAGLHADGFAILDLAASWQASAAAMVQLLIKNVTDEAAIVSHRPFGARPNRPLAVVVRLKVTLGD